MYNSDGYVLIDLTGVDITKTNQHLTGIYNRVLTVIDINKLALVINAGDLTPMAAVVHKKLNYYVINTPLYIFTINSNDIIMIEEAGEATVDVAIVPALLDGVKIADYTIGAVDGSLYAPEQQSEINDNITTDYTTWSSDKINTALSSKANTADVYTKAQVDTALAAKADTSDIPTKTSQLQNDSGFITSAQVPTIDDSSVSASSVWSSYKTSAELGNKANSSDVYTKSEVDTTLGNYQTTTDNTLDTTSKTVVGGINELNNEVGISEYNPNKTYNVGEYCYHNGDTYYCNQNSVTGTWDPTKWNASSLSNDLQNIVVRRTLTETTTGNGNVVNHIEVVHGIIVSANCTSQEAIVTTFVNSQGTHYSFHVVSPTANAPVIANTQVTIEFYMIPRRRIINA